MKGGAIAKFVNPLGMIGTPMKGGVIANFVCPSRYDWERRGANNIAAFVRPACSRRGTIGDGAVHNVD